MQVLGQRTDASLLEEELTRIPVIKNARAALVSPLMIQQRKEKTKQNTIDPPVQIWPRAEADLSKPLKPELSSEAGNDPSDTAQALPWPWGKD